jgi:nucleotide-binding universal stress UspA family protein
VKSLVAYDGSEPAKLALDRTAEIARLENAEVSVISVAPVLRSGRAGGVDPTSDLHEHRRELEEAVRRLAAAGISAQAVEGVGDPADAIIRLAEQDGTNLVVVGSRGLSGVERFLMGSVSMRVAQHAPCNVYIAR